MLRTLKTNFLKTRVIGLGYQTPKVMINMCKAGFEDPDGYFLEYDAMKYYESKFYAHLAKNWSIDESLLSPTELSKFNESKQILADFENLYDFIHNQHEFYWELKSLYLEIQRETSTYNFWSRREYSTHTLESDIQGCLQKYLNLMDATKDNEEWNTKIKDECGYYIHIIYNQFVSDPKFQEMFQNFEDKHYFFK